MFKGTTKLKRSAFMMKKFAVLFACMFLLAPVLAGAMTKVGDSIQADLEVTTMGGAAPVKMLSLLAKDNFTAVVFMNTSCSSCMQEMAGMQKLAAETKKLTLIAVSVDVKGKEAVERFLGANEAYKDLTFVLDPKYALATKFAFSFTPASVIVDSKGKVLAREIGWNAENEAEVTKLVKGN
jgi:thiol-disulfide isomerase/thioredoxin